LNPRTTILLFLLVAVLGGLVWWQTDREAQGEFDIIEPLFEDVELPRIAAIRVDNVERAVHVKLEKSGFSGWILTDPVAYPAESAVVRLLLDSVTNNMGVVLAGEQAAEAAAQFGTPRSLIEVTEALPDGSMLARTIELGPLDIDGQSLLVRKGDRYFRTPRNIDNTLQRTANDYRSRSAFQLDLSEVVFIRREGVILTQEGSTDVGLELYREGAGWRMERPWRAKADATVANVFLQGVGSTKISSFMSEGQDSLEKYALHLPELSLTLSMASGVEQTIRVADPGRIFAKRDDLPYVWELDGIARSRMEIPAEAMLATSLATFFRDSVEEVELVDSDRVLRIRQEAVKLERGRAPTSRGLRWTVAERPRGGDEYGMQVPADGPSVDAILAALESSEVAGFALEGSQDDPFADGVRRFRVRHAGEQEGGVIGRRYVSPEGSEAYWFRRDGDSISGWVPADFVEALFGHTAASLRTLQLFEVEEAALKHMSLRHAGVEREFHRTQQGVWQVPDLDQEATELRPVLDKLFFLRATEHLPAEGEELRDPVRVAISDRRGNVYVADIGLGPEGRVEADVLGARSILAAQDLHAQLTSIVATKHEGGGQ